STDSNLAASSEFQMARAAPSSQKGAGSQTSEGKDSGCSNHCWVMRYRTQASVPLLPAINTNGKRMTKATKKKEQPLHSSQFRALPVISSSLKSLPLRCHAPVRNTPSFLDPRVSAICV